MDHSWLDEYVKETRMSQSCHEATNERSGLRNIHINKICLKTVNYASSQIHAHACIFHLTTSAPYLITKKHQSINQCVKV